MTEINPKLQVADLALRQKQYQGLAVAITNQMQLGIQATPGAPDASGNSPFLSRLAAVRWAFRGDASIITLPVAIRHWRQRR